MGNCAGQRSTSKRKFYQQLPSDLENFNPRSNPGMERMSFECELFNVKVIGKTEGHMYMRFKVEGVIQILFPKKAITENETKWKTKGKFGIKGNEYEIRKLFLNIDLLDETDISIGTLKINLYLMMTGPYHNDLEVQLANGGCLRIVFDLKISQIVQLKLKSTKSQIHFYEQYPGQRFNYTIRAKVSEFQQIEQTSRNAQSAPSYTFTVPLSGENSFRQFSQEQQLSQNIQLICNSPLRRKISRKASNMIPVETPSVLNWVRQQSDQMPSFKIKMKSSELTTSLLQVTLWKILVDQQRGGISMEPFGQMAIQLTELLDKRMLIDQSNGSDRQNIAKENSEHKKQESASKNKLNASKPLDSHRENYLQVHSNKNGKDGGQHPSVRTAAVEGEMYMEDKKIGSCKMEFEISNTNYIMQKNACARTEEGIVSMLPIEVYSLNKFKDESFTRVCKCFDEIAGTQSAINDKDVRKSNKNWNKYSSLKLLLQQFLAILQETHKDSLVHVAEQQQDQMLFRQLTLLNIANQIKELIENNDSILSDLCWKVENQLFKRGQLLLSNIGFRAHHQREMKNGHLTELLKRKIEIGLRYQQTLYTLLQIALSSGICNIYGFSTGHRGSPSILNLQQDPRQIFKVNCYLAVPIFRQKFLSEITRNGLVDTRSQPRLQDKATVKSRHKKHNSATRRSQNNRESLLMTLEYEQHFYKWLKENSKKSSNLNEQLIEQLNVERWVTYMASKEKGSFYCFIRTLMSQLEKYREFMEIPHFHYVPGYNKLAGSILKSFQQTELEKYSADLCNTAVSMLLNHDLLNSFLTVVLQKINLYNQASVLKGLDLIGRFFAKVARKRPHQRTGRISSDALQPLFLKSIRIILQDSQSVLSLAKTLQMIYDFFPKFQKCFQQTLSLLLLGKLFNRLFYHWSYQIRVSFHYILILRIAQCEKRSQSAEFADRYDTILRIIPNAQRARIKEQMLNQGKKSRKTSGDSNKEEENGKKDQVEELWIAMREKLVRKKRKLAQKTHMRRLGMKKNEESRQVSQNNSIRHNVEDVYESHMRRLSEDYGLGTLKRSNSIQLQIINLKQKMLETQSGYYGRQTAEMPDKQRKKTSEEQEPQEEGEGDSEQAIFKFQYQPSFMETNHIIDITEVKEAAYVDPNFQHHNSEDYQLKQLLQNQLPYILPATNQFRQLNAQIERIVTMGHQIPDLDINTEIIYDKKDIRPRGIDKLEFSKKD